MPYIGNNHIAGDHTNNFKVLDDISSFTATFDGSATSVVDTTNNTIRVVEHRFVQGQRVTYTNGSGGNIGGLTTGTAYFVIFDSASTIKLATNASNAASSTAINLSAVGTGSSHTLNAAFDGVNTKFKITYNGGTGARFNNATQLNIAINNVLQKPNVSSITFTEGFAIEDNHKIVFKTAPTSEDIFWGSIIANTLTTFDISDHKIDTFTGDGSTTEFTLSHTPANNESLMVTINGVLQHPSNASTARAYTLIASIIQFTAAPGVGDEIQVRHMGFAGATTADVSGFYGRTGNVVLTSNDHITTGNINAGIVTATSFHGSFSPNVGGSNANFTGIVTAGVFKGGDIEGRNLKITGLSTFVGDASFTGNVSIGGTLTYEDVTNIDSVGIITARSSIYVADSIIHQGDTDTKIEFSTNDIRTTVGNKLRIHHASNGLNYFNGNNISQATSTHTKLAGSDYVHRFRDEEGDDTLVQFFNTNVKNTVLEWNAFGNTTAAGNLIFRDINTGNTEYARFTGTGSFNIAKDLDVDGHTNLDNVSIAGVTTITGSGSSVLFLESSNPMIRLTDTDNSAYSSIGGESGFLYLYTNSSSRDVIFRGSQEVARLTGDGLLGIGTNNPTAPIHLHKASGDAIQKIESSNGAASLELRHTNGYGYINYRQDGAETFRVGQIAQFTSYSVYNPNSSLPYQLCVEGNGEVGINTHNPGDTLHLLRNNTNHGIRLQRGGTNPGTAYVQVHSNGVLSLQGGNNIHYVSGGSQQHIWYRAGTQIAKFDTSGRFMIGTSTEGHVSADDLTIEGSGDSGITIRSGSSSEGSIMFSDGTSGTAEYAGWINYNHNSNFMRFFVGGERLRINNSGNVGINEASNINGRLHVQHDALGENILYATRYNDQTNDKPILAVTEASMTGMTASGLVIGTHNRGIHIGPVFDDAATVNTGSQTGIRILHTGNVGINEGAPLAKLHVREGDSGVTSPDTSQDTLFLENAGNAGLTIATPSGNTGYLTFADPDDSNIGQIIYRHSNNSMAMFVNASERINIQSSGNVQIGTAADPGNALRYVDIGNYNTGSSAGSIVRLLTVKSDGSSSTSADIVKYKAGGLVINNNEAIGTAGFISFGTATGGGSTTERLRIDSSGFIKQTFSSNNSTVAEGLFINNKDNSTGINASLIFSCDSGERKKASISYIDTGAYGTGDMVFALDNDADSGELHVTNHERMRITKDGIVRLSNSSGAMLDLRTSAGTGNCWVQLSDSSGNQKGYFGFGSSSNETLYIVQQESANISLYTGNATRWNWNTSGHYYPQTDSQVDIGTSSYRVRTIYSDTINVSANGNNTNGTVANFRGGVYNQINICHANNSGWGLLLTNTDQSTYGSNSGYHYSTNTGVNSPCAVVNVNSDALHLATANTSRWFITHQGMLLPYASGGYDLGGGSNRVRNMYGQTLSLTSYATIGSLVVNDPGSHYYSFNNRIGGNSIIKGTTVLGDVGTATKPSTFPASNVQLMVYNSTNGQPISNTNCARLLIATDAKQTGAQGYHGAMDFGSSDCSAAGSSAEFNWRTASIMCRGDGDTSATAADGDLQFYTKQASGSLTHRFDIAPNGDLTGTDQNIGNLSDQRLKTNIQDYTYDLNKFKQLKTRTFDWINPEFHREGNQRGFIAQEVETVDNYWNYQFEVSKENAEKDYDLLSDGDENYTIRDHRPAKASKLTGKDAMYVSVIQQLMSKIETLEAKVATLEGS